MIQQQAVTIRYVADTRKEYDDLLAQIAKADVSVFDGAVEDLANLTVDVTIKALVVDATGKIT